MHSLFTKKGSRDNDKMVEMDENVTLAAQLEESCKHENFNTKSTVQFFTKGTNPHDEIKGSTSCIILCFVSYLKMIISDIDQHIPSWWSRKLESF
jgi:hypothetical protein